MKIKPEHYEFMRDTIIQKLNTQGPIVETYIERGLSPKRLRWDALWSAGLGSWLSKEIYPYANDEHIDTTLRSIMREYGTSYV